MTERVRQNVIIPQVNEPLGYADGKPVYPTVAWQQYFEGLWKRTGAFNDGLLEEIVRSFVETSENRAAIEAITGLVRALESLAQSNAEDSRQSIEEAFSRLRRLEDNLRAQVESTLASLGELSRLDVAGRENIATGAISDTKLAANLIIEDGASQPMLDRAAGKLFIDGYEVNRLFSSSPTSNVSIVNTDTAGKVIARADLLDVRKINSWALIGSVIDFAASGTGTMTSSDVANFKLRIAFANPQASPPNIEDSVAGFTSGGTVLEWDVSFNHAGVITINSAIITGAPVITNEELNGELGNVILRYVVTGNTYAYLSARFVSTTAADASGIALRFSTNTVLSATNLINRNA